MTEALKHMRLRGQSLSILYPFKHAFYRKYGYAVFGDMTVLKSDPNNVTLPESFQPLHIEKFTKDESFAKIKAFRSKIGRNYNLVMHENPTTWKFFHFRDRDELRVVKDGEDIVGYFISRIKDLPSSKWATSLDFGEVIVARETARLTILDYIKKHKDQTKEFRWPLMGDEQIFDYFNDLWALKIETYPAAMFRVVDVEQALQKLKFPRDVTVSFSLQLHDDFAPWNEDPLLIEIDEGNAQVAQVDKLNGHVDLETDITAFTQLFVGYKTIGQLAATNKLNVKEKIKPQLAKAFPKKTTRLTTHF